MVSLNIIDLILAQVHIKMLTLLGTYTYLQNINTNIRHATTTGYYTYIPRK